MSAARVFKKTDRAAFVNFLRAKYEMYVRSVRVGTHPYIMLVEPSDRCQLRCPTCPTGIENEGRRAGRQDATVFRPERHRMSRDLFDAVLEEVGKYLFLVMFYNYGEPLLNTELPGFIRKAKAYRIDTEVHSNLSMPLSDRRIEDILTSGLDCFLAAIDGFSQETYQIHRVGGDFALAKSNLERMVRTRDRLGLKTRIEYGFLVFSFNQHEVGKVARYCRDLGIEFEIRHAFVDDARWLPSQRKGESPWVVPEEARLKKDAHWGWSPLPRAEGARMPAACGWHYGYSVITAGGRVASCDAVAKAAHDMGEIVPRSSGFGDVWNGARYRKARAAVSESDQPDLADVDTLCTRCPYPKEVRHIYSFHDFKVLRQFQSVFQGKDPVLEQGFDLFSKMRYGVSLAAAADDGFALPPTHLFVGSEGRNDTADFVQFIERNLPG